MALLAFLGIIVASLGAVATGNFLASIFEFDTNTNMWVQLGCFILILFGVALAGK